MGWTKDTWETALREMILGVKILEPDMMLCTDAQRGWPKSKREGDISSEMWDTLKQTAEVFKRKVLHVLEDEQSKGNCTFEEVEGDRYDTYVAYAVTPSHNLPFTVDVTTDDLTYATLVAVST